MYKHFLFSASFGDPHFLVRIKDLRLPICFDLPGKDKQLQILLYDPVRRINITAKIVEGKGRFKPDRPLRTYIGQLYITSPHMTVIVTPHKIAFNNHIFTWDNETGVTSSSSTLGINGRGKYMEFGISKGQKLLIRRNLESKMAPNEGYLDFFVISGKGFSKEASGIIARFSDSMEFYIHLLNKTLVLRGFTNFCQLSPLEQCESKCFIQEHNISPGRCLSMKGKLLQTHRNAIGRTKATLTLTLSDQHETKVVNATLKYRQGWMYTTVPCWMVDSKELTFHLSTA
uniref:Inter-alpha-trypsin inhibitor heavy chain C-terminal domain-containing protein n=1 Tax=Octopus bimaculoides TaxID=37653 RepID=A0A0L8FK53_OCTBM